MLYKRFNQSINEVASVIMKDLKASGTTLPNPSIERTRRGKQGCAAVLRR